MPWRRIIRVAVVAAYGVLLVAGQPAAEAFFAPAVHGLVRMFCAFSVFVVSPLLGLGAALGERPWWWRLVVSPAIWFGVCVLYVAGRSQSDSSWIGLDTITPVSGYALLLIALLLSAVRWLKGWRSSMCAPHDRWQRQDFNSVCGSC